MKTTRPLQLACVSLLLIRVAFELLSAGAGQSVRPASAQQAVATTDSTAIPRSQASTPVISVAISRRLTSGPDLRPRSSELNRLYDAALPAPLWADKDGRPNRSAREGLTLLRCADDEGLEPHDYGSADLDRLAATLDAAGSPGVDDVATFDVALSAAMLRYFRDLHLGRVDPRSIGFRVRLPDDGHDFAALLRAAVAGHHVPTPPPTWRQLAAWVLRNDPAWNQERILAAMSGPTTQSVDLAIPIQVILFYVTAVVMPEDGTIHFADDIYRHDLRLDRALVTARRAPALQRSR